MTYCGKKTSKQGLLISLGLVLLSGCGMESSSDNENGSAPGAGPAEPTMELAGAAMKGVIQQGIVTPNLLVADNAGVYGPHHQAAEEERTADDGSYSFRLSGNADDWALVELTSDGATRMICDVVPECQQADAQAVAFGQPMPLDNNFSLRGAGDLGLGNVNLTPLTHLATALAERSANGLSPDALVNAYGTVEGWFGLAEGALNLTIPDLTRLDEQTNVTADALQVAIANASFLALVNDNAQWDTISEVLTDVTSQVRNNGQISVLGDGTNVALADLISAAAVQASNLQMEVSSSIVSQKLVVVEYRNVQRFKTIGDVDTGGDDASEDTGSDGTNDDTTDDTSDGTSGSDGSTDDTTDDTTDDNSGDASDSDDTTDSGSDGSTDNDGGNDTDSDSSDSGSDTTDTGNDNTDSGDDTTDTGDDTTDTGDDTTDTGDDTTDSGSDTTDSTPAVPDNAALLSWTAPLTRENGESLAMGEIAGFEVVYGTDAETLDQSLAIGDSSVDELMINDLAEGTWYFAIRTLDTDGRRSQLSNVVSKQI